MEFYETTLLFRQNALRRTPSTGSKRRNTNPDLKENFTRSLWLLDSDMTKDIALTNKVCSLDRAKIKSSYWKIPDAEMNLTSLALSDSEGSANLAISSANTDNNLYLYELDPYHDYLTHHTTISLPNIHSLCWVKNTHARFLVSGNSKGFAHLLSLPRETSDGVPESAEIVKRFNHRKYLRLVNKDPALIMHRSTTVHNLGFLADSLVTTYDDTLFLWALNDVHLPMRPRPASISVVPGIAGFDVPATNSSTLALCGLFGVSLFDTRQARHSVPSSSLAKSGAAALAANSVKWHGSCDYKLASAHADGRVHLWDIRMNDTFAEISGHSGKAVTTMAWNGNDLFTGASDGIIAHWDLSSGLDPEQDMSSQGDKLRNCTLKEGINSVVFDAVSNSFVPSAGERQCGTLLPALNNKIVGMCLLVESIGAGSRCKILLIDGAAFLGLHGKIYDAATGTDDKKYYSREDLALINLSVSGATLVYDESCAPLSVAKPKKQSLEPSKGFFFDDSQTESSSLELPRADHDPASSPFVSGLPVVSLHSVYSANEHRSSTFSDASDNSSLTLTTATSYDEEQLPKKEFLLEALEADLRRLCSGYAPESSF